MEGLRKIYVGRVSYIDTTVWRGYTRIGRWQIDCASPVYYACKSYDYMLK